MQYQVETTKSQGAAEEKIAHTPGPLNLYLIEPWGRPVYSDDEKSVIGYEGGNPTYELVPKSKDEEFLEAYCGDTQYTVKLICNDLPMPFAAAPELLEALKSVVSDLEWGTAGRWKGEGSKSLRAAIAKAEGK